MLWLADLQARYLFKIVLIVSVDRGNPLLQPPVAHDRVRKFYLLCLICDEGLPEHALQGALQVGCVQDGFDKFPNCFPAEAIHFLRDPDYLQNRDREEVKRCALVFRFPQEFFYSSGFGRIVFNQQSQYRTCVDKGLISVHELPRLPPFP